MKTLCDLTIKTLILGVVLLFAGCTAEENVEIYSILIPIENTELTPIENTDSTNIFFGFLDGDGSSDTYIDMPIESSTTNLLIGRWKITKIGVDENNDGHSLYYSFENYDHKDCGLSFLQFNNNGVVFENSYFKSNGTCTLYSEIDNWEIIGDRIQIYDYNNIYILKVNESELILHYDWNFENSLYGPTQVYYYFERIQASN